MVRIHTDVHQSLCEELSDLIFRSEMSVKDKQSLEILRSDQVHMQ